MLIGQPRHGTKPCAHLPIPWRARWFEALAYVAAAPPPFGVSCVAERCSPSHLRADSTWLSFPICLAYLAPLVILFTK